MGLLVAVWIESGEGFSPTRATGGVTRSPLQLHHQPVHSPRQLLLSNRHQDVDVATSSSLSLVPLREMEEDEEESLWNHQKLAARVWNRRPAVTAAAVGLASVLSSPLSPPLPAVAAYIDPSTNPPKVTHQVYLDVKIGDNDSQRIHVNLFGEAMPRTVQHFMDMCQNNGYAGTYFYRVLSDYNIQGGGNRKGLVDGDNVAVLEPDNFDLQHTVTGLVSMVRSTPAGGMDQRFFIQLAADGGWADDRYAAFGVVANDEASMAVVKQIEQVPVKRPANFPTTPITIMGSGVVNNSS